MGQMMSSLLSQKNIADLLKNVDAEGVKFVGLDAEHLTSARHLYFSVNPLFALHVQHQLIA